MKKQLPKAIQPNVTHRINPVAHLVSAPVPEAMRPRKASKVSTAAIMDVTEKAPIDERRAHARKLVERFSLWAGAAGLLPVPIIDLDVVGGLHIHIVRRLSHMCDVPFYKRQA